MTQVSRRRQSKAISLVYGAIASVVLLVIAALALVVVPPAPPSVAEFAPQAVEQIDEAPNQQSSQFGAGTGACAEGQVCEGSTQAPVRPAQRTVVERARVKRCVGDPPRQIEDPQSPPCVGYWEGDNGGATSKGVARDEIRIAWGKGSSGPSLAEDILDSLVVFFNRRFEFYGRRIRLVKYTLTPCCGISPTTMRTTAAKIDEELGAFASLPYPGNVGLGSAPFYEELARRGVLGVDNTFSVNTEKDLYFPRRPYQWNYQMALDKYERNQAEWFCNAFAGRPASLAGPEFQTVPRKLGVLVTRTSGGTADVSILAGAVTKCTSSAVHIVEVAGSSTDDERTATIANLRGAGVTSVTCYCDGTALAGWQSSASSSAYFPEWLLNPFFGQDDDVFGRGQQPEQRSHTFGLTSKNKLNRQQDAPWYWAATEINPAFAGTDYGAAAGPAVATYVPTHYQALLLLASGIQMAGPKLTPQTFEAGLVRTSFPNPGAGSAPYFQARVGFPAGDHTMVQDLAMIWYDESAESYGGSGVQSGRGSYCYVERGKRYGLGQWPTERPRYFDRTAPCK